VAAVRTGEAFLAQADRRHRVHRLSAGAPHVLAVLDGEGGSLSPTVIADRLIITTASMTSLLDTLQRRGLVQRTPDVKDRRRVVVTITAEGSRVIRRLLPEMLALQAEVATGLSPPDRTELVRLLSILRDGIAAAGETTDRNSGHSAHSPKSGPPRGPN
jgi:DNA-binding MarR family transcriptional regulator